MKKLLPEDRCIKRTISLNGRAKKLFLSIPPRKRSKIMADLLEDFYNEEMMI